MAPLRIAVAAALAIAVGLFFGCGAPVSAPPQAVAIPRAPSVAPPAAVPAEAPPADALGGDKRDKSDGAFEPPADTHSVDSALPRGTVAVELRDADEKPAPNQTVFLAQISDAPAPNVAAVTDSRGRATLSAPSWVGGSARVVTHNGEAELWTERFPIPTSGGVKVILHSYASVKDISDVVVVFQSLVLVEADGATLKVTHSLKAYNFSRVAWLPKDLALPLPKGFSGFEHSIYSETSMNITVDGGRALLSGTIAPGTHLIDMSWHVPLRGGTAKLRIAMPPHVAAARVLTWAGPKTKLEVAGFPAATASTSGDGKSAFVTERQLKRSEAPLQEIDIDVRGAVTAPRTLKP